MIEPLLALADASSPWSDPSVWGPGGVILAGACAAIRMLWTRCNALTDAHTKALAEITAAHAKQLDETRDTYLEQIKALTDAGRVDGNELNEKYHTAILSLKEVIESLRRSIVERRRTAG